MSFQSILFRNADGSIKADTVEAPECFGDLNLDQIVEAITAGKKEYNLVPIFYTPLRDPAAIYYRHEVMQDLEDPTLMTNLKVFAEKMALVRRYLAMVEKLDFNYHKKGWFLEAALVYSESVSDLARYLSLANLRSRGLSAFRQYITDYTHSHGFQSLSTEAREVKAGLAGLKYCVVIQPGKFKDEYFAVVTDHLKTLKFRNGILISAELGPGNEGTNYVLRKAHPAPPNWFKQVMRRKSPVYSYTLPPRDDHGARALGDLRDRGINLVANAVAQSADHIDSFFQMLQLELAFYIGCLNLSEQLAQRGVPIGFPEPAPVSERRLSFTGLYDVTLALTSTEKVVGNDVNADGKNLVIITGANQGGKTTFLRALGQSQLMMQCGMFVPAESYCANLCQGIFTHFKREEDATMKSGKLDEELGRMSGIVSKITPNSIILFNESFAATNDREGSEIARQITSALVEKRIKVYFVTHLYDFARGFYEARLESTLFLRAERQEDGERTFKLIEGEPLETSYGGDVYRQIFGNADVDQPETGVIEMAASTASNLLD